MTAKTAVFRFIETDKTGQTVSTTSYSLDRNEWLPGARDAVYTLDVATTSENWARIHSSDHIRQLTQSGELRFSGYLPLLASHDSEVIRLILEFSGLSKKHQLE